MTEVSILLPLGTGFAQDGSFHKTMDAQLIYLARFIKHLLISDFTKDYYIHITGQDKHLFDERKEWLPVLAQHTQFVLMSDVDMIVPKLWWTHTKQIFASNPEVGFIVPKMEGNNFCQLPKDVSGFAVNEWLMLNYPTEPSPWSPEGEERIRLELNRFGAPQVLQEAVECIKEGWLGVLDGFVVYRSEMLKQLGYVSHRDYIQHGWKGYAALYTVLHDKFIIPAQSSQKPPEKIAEYAFYGKTAVQMVDERTVPGSPVV